MEKGETVSLSSGNQIRDFMNVVDVGKKIAEIAIGKINGPINICSGIPITVRQFVEQIADEYNRRDLLQFNDRLDNGFDPPCVIGIPNI